MKKEIIFVEAKPTIYTFKIARALKLTKKYRTILFSFSRLDEKKFGRAFDEINILEWSHKINFKNFIDFFIKLFGRKGRIFFNKLKNAKPYLFQLTGPDLFTFLTMISLKNNNRPKIYFAYDIWGIDKRNFLFTIKPGIKGSCQKIFERFCFKMADGVLHKGHKKEPTLVPYKIKCPTFPFILFLLDEWIQKPSKRKNDKNFSLVYSGGPLSTWKGRIPFIDITRIITCQKINFCTTHSSIDQSDDSLFIQEEKENKYFKFNKEERKNELGAPVLSEYDYGILPDFYSPSFDLSNRKYEMAGKMIKYLEAGIPIIMNEQLEFMADIVKENGIGITINLKGLKNLKQVLNDTDYRVLQKNIIKTQEKFKLSNTIKNLEEFYEKIVTLKKSLLNAE